MDFELKPLSYSYDALEPHLSAETLRLHHDKHLGGYLKKLEELIGDTPQADETLESLVMSSKGPIFENAAQIWNHEFLWHSMSPKGGGEPQGAFAEALRRDFGSIDAFRKAFLAAAGGHFGSGWAWLVVDAGRLTITTTDNADLPLRHRQAAVLTADLWEHAYYVDYRNDRHAYLEAFLGHLVDWDFAAATWAATSGSRR